MVSVAGALAGSCRSKAAELGPGPGVRESRGGEEVTGLEVGALAGGSACVAEERAASAAGPLLARAIPSTTCLPMASNHLGGGTKRHHCCPELHGDLAILGPIPSPFLLCALHPCHGLEGSPCLHSPHSGTNAQCKPWVTPNCHNPAPCCQHDAPWGCYADLCFSLV